MGGRHPPGAPHHSPTAGRRGLHGLDPVTTDGLGDDVRNHRRKSAASFLNRLQRPFDAASARCRQTEDYRAAADLAPRPRQHPAQRTRRLRSVQGRCGARSSCSASADRQQLAEPVGPPSQPKAAPSPAVSLGLTAGAEVLALPMRGRTIRSHQLIRSHPVTCTTRDLAGWPTAPLMTLQARSSPGQTRRLAQRMGLDGPSPEPGSFTSDTIRRGLVARHVRRQCHR
jgi:hypothetical protein